MAEDIMVEDIIPYGECLYGLIRRKNISVSRLAALAGVKSRTSIQRILRDECTIGIIEAFNRQIRSFDELSLSDLELGQLDQALMVSKVGKDAYQARKIMLQLFETKSRTDIIDPAGLDPSNNRITTLGQIFKTYHGYAKLRFVIFDLSFISFTDQLVNLIRHSPPGYVSVSQLMRFNSSRNQSAATFAASFQLLNYEHLDVYSISDDSVSDERPVISSNSIVVDKELADGSHYTDFILMAGEEEFTFMSNLPGKTLYSFYLHHFDQITMKGQSVRKTYKKVSPFDVVINNLETCTQLEKLSPRYIIKHSFSSSMIPLEVISQVISESNLGLSKNHPIINSVMQGFSTRFDAFYQSNKSKINLLTKWGLLDFVNSGMLTDHFHSARAFTRDEVKFILEFIFDQLKNNEYFQILLLKNDHAIGNLEFSYYEDQVLWVFDSYSGYGEDYFEAIIDSPPLLELFDDFIKNEFIPNHTLPQSETIEFLEYLMSIA